MAIVNWGDNTEDGVGDRAIHCALCFVVSTFLYFLIIFIAESKACRLLHLRYLNILGFYIIRPEKLQ